MKLSISTVAGYSLTLISIFRYKIPGIRDRFFLRDLLRSVEIEGLLKSVGPPTWNLVMVVEHLRDPVSKPFVSKPLRILIM